MSVVVVVVAVVVVRITEMSTSFWFQFKSFSFNFIDLFNKPFSFVSIQLHFAQVFSKHKLKACFTPFLPLSFYQISFRKLSNRAVHKPPSYNWPASTTYKTKLSLSGFVSQYYSQCFHSK